MKQQINYGHENGVSGRRNRTSRTVMFFRMCVTMWIITFSFGWLTSGFIPWVPRIGQLGHEFGAGGATRYDQIMQMLGYTFISIPGGIFMCIWPIWLVLAILGEVYYRPKSPEWAQFFDEGGSLWWDKLMIWPVNPDSLVVRHGGIDPILPIPEGVHIEPRWPYYCNKCYNRLPYEFCPCGVCGNNAPTTVSTTPIHPHAVPVRPRP